MEILPRLNRVDLMLTDPPYGISASGGTGKYGVAKFKDADYEWDSEPIGKSVIDTILKYGEESIVWGGNYFELPPSRGYLVWDKGAGFKNRKFAECEQAWVSKDMNARIFQYDPLARGDYRDKLHPTQKPLSVMSWCLSLFPDAKAIIDPFMGSGTTLVAAKQRGLKCIGIERELKYCEIAVERLAQGVLLAA